MGQDLIWIVRFRSGGSGLGPRGAALSRRRPKSRGGAARKPRRTSAFWGFQGLVWAGVWPWSTTTACVTHRRQQGGGSGRGTACAAAKAALRGGAHRRARVCMNQSIIQGATGTVGREGAYRCPNLSWGVVRGVGVELHGPRRGEDWSLEAAGVERVAEETRPDSTATAAAAEGPRPHPPPPMDCGSLKREPGA